MKTYSRYQHQQQFTSYNHIRFDGTEFPLRKISRPIVLELAAIIICLTTIPVFKIMFPSWIDMYSTPFDKVDAKLPMNRTVNFLMEPFVETPVNVIVMVNSHPSESQLRREIRKSWGDPKYYDRTYTRLIFLVGRPVSQNELEQVVEEHRDFNDILVADIKEDYYLLSIKTYAMLYYKMTKLPQTRCLVKADSDNVLNLHNYEKLCEETIAPRIVGSCDVDTTVLRTKSKWAIPVDIYPLPQWPTYCSSGTYVFCGEDVPERILQSSEDTQFFSSTNFRRLPEDVLFTGIFAEKAGISRKHVGTMTFRDKPAFSCRTRQYTYSIHMHRRKNPISYHLRMLSQEGILC